MFRKLKVKLVIINIVIVIVILLVFNERPHSGQPNERSPILTGPVETDERNSRESQPADYFYVKTSGKGNIVEIFPGEKVARQQAQDLVDKTMDKPERAGMIELDGGEFYGFLKTPLYDDENLLLFINKGTEAKHHGPFADRIIFWSGILVLIFGGCYLMASRAFLPIEKSWLRQRNFVADASHELRTPLAVIQTNLELVMGEPEKTVRGQAKWLQNIYAEIIRMTRLLEDMLYLARADSQQELSEKKYFPLHTAIKKALSPFEPIASEKEIQLSLFVDLAIDFYGNEERIKQLAVILLDNAIKYTPPAGEIVFKLLDQGNSIIIDVSDTGVGIEREHLNKIFERFYRGDKARSRKDGGTGLGLAIADLIVKEHRGTIRISSLPGKGTTFHITLPKLNS